MKTVVTQLVAAVTVTVPNEWGRARIARELANHVVWSKDDPKGQSTAVLRNGQLQEVRFGALTETDFTVDGLAHTDEAAVKAAPPAAKV